MINSDKISNEFKRIKALEFIKSNRSHDTGIGKTFEDYLGVDENNKKDPDFEDFEVKSQRELAKSYITLFTKKATHPIGANRYLKDNFGKQHENFPDVRILHTSIFGDRYNTSYGQFGFKINVNEELKKLELEIIDLATNELVSNDVHWTFSDIQGEKLKNTFVVWAKRKKIDGEEYFHYTKAQVYYNFSFQKLMDGVKKGFIMFDIRMGAYNSGKNKGRPHDHGSGFRVKKENLKDLFDVYIEVE